MASPAAPPIGPEYQIAGLPEHEAGEWSRHSDLNRGPAVYEGVSGLRAPIRPLVPVQNAADRGSWPPGVNPVKYLGYFTDFVKRVHATVNSP